MTDRLGFILWPALAILAGCATMRTLDVTDNTQPPTPPGPIITMVEWKTPEGVAIRCAQLQAAFGKFPAGGYGCAYAHPGQPITLVLPLGLHPLISHELGHAHQLRRGEPVDHKGWK